MQFRNEKGEECVIQFNDKIEICGKRKRRVIRKDFRIPKNWAPQSEDVTRCLLNPNDNDYMDVLNRFNETMSRKYTWIQIERIQNQRWYMGYRTLRNYSNQKDTEQLLFHGCQETSADMIIHSCFNRSFAGVHGKQKVFIYSINLDFSIDRCRIRSRSLLLKESFLQPWLYS